MNTTQNMKEVVKMANKIIRGLRKRLKKQVEAGHLSSAKRLKSVIGEVKLQVNLAARNPQGVEGHYNYIVDLGRKYRALGEFPTYSRELYISDLDAAPTTYLDVDHYGRLTEHGKIMLSLNIYKI